MSRSKREKYLQKKSTPGGEITVRAFNYSCSFYDFAAEKLPELKPYPPEKARGTALQAAIIVGTLILMERRSGGVGWNTLHLEVARAFAPSVAHRNVAAIQDLACVLLGSDRHAVVGDAIPSLAKLAGESDENLKAAIGSWLSRVLSQKRHLEPPDERVAQFMGRSAWTSATMIVRALASKAAPNA
jgi:hypothetical protein